MTGQDRRLISRSTASRIKAARPYVPTSLSIASIDSCGSRTGTRVWFRGGRPIGRGVARSVAADKKTAPFSVATVNGPVYINGTLYGGKAMNAQVRGFTISECHPGAYHVTCWNADHTSCGVATYYDPGCSPFSDPMLLTENVAALEAQGRVNMTGNRYDYQTRQWIAS